VAGRINDEDVVTVRERARIDEVIGPASPFATPVAVR
jgi:hypothetical protein